MNFLKSESYKKGIVLSTTFNIFAKLVSFINSIIVAYYFGTQGKTDIYFYAIATIGMFIAFVTALDHSVLIPESMRIREQESNEKSMQFLNFFIYIYLGIGCFAIIILYINPVKIFSFVSKFDITILQSNIDLLYLIIPLCVLMLLTNYIVNILVSYKYFTIPMIAAFINNLFSIFFVLIFHDQLDVKSILLGLMFGYFLNISLLFYILFKKIHWNFRFVKVSLGKKVIHNMFYAQAGNITSLFAAYAPLYFLSGFNVGLITAMNYGRSTSEIPANLITTQISSVSGIKFNELYVRKDFIGLNQKFIATTNFLLFILMPISGIFFLYSDEIITILFKRGAFDVKSVKMSAIFFKYLGLLLPCMAVNTMCARLFMATQKIRESFFYQIIFNIILFILYLILIYYYDIYGYMIAIISIYFLNIFIVYFLCKFMFEMIHYQDIIWAFLKLLFTNGMIICVLLLLNPCFGNKSLLRIAIGGCIYFGLILMLNYLFVLNKEFLEYCKILLRKIMYIK
jgi:peptidoglycan biosynthesis protein MviN/MurJ (putative lipid II flippase)